MKLQQLFVLPTSADAEEIRTTRLIKIIAFTIEATITIYGLALLVTAQHFERFYLLGSLVPLLVGVHLLLHYKYVHLAGLVEVCGTWLVIIISAFTSGGVLSPTFYICVVPILLAGLLIERRAGIALAVASSLLGLLMIWYEGQVTTLPPDSPFNDPFLCWLIGSLTFGAVAIFQYMEVSDLSAALTQARANERALAESNQTLQARTQELEQQEQALQQSESHMRALVQTLPDSIVRVRGDGLILDVKSPTNFAVSVPADQLIGRTVQDSFPPELAQQLLWVNQQGLETKTIQIYEYSIPVGTETRWRESRVFAISDDEVIAIVRDITPRKRALETLHQSEERYRKLVELSPDAILLYRNERVLFSNPAGLCLWGASTLSELVGRPITELVHIAEQQEMQTWEETMFERGDIIPNAALKIVQMNGTLVDVEVAAVAYQTPEGIAIQAIYRDVTERKQAAEKTQQLLHEVEAQRSQLRALNVRLAKTEENERKRLAQELHDGVAQDLTGLNLNLNVLRRHMQQELAAESRAHSRLHDAITLVEQTTVQIRKVMSDLRPPVLDDYGLLATLEWYVAQLVLDNDLQIEVLGETLTPRPAEYVELTLFRIVQEALTNVIHHAQATQAVVVLTADESTIYISISDDGLGIRATEAGHPPNLQSWGLLAMRERAEAIGGHCQIESYPFLGTSVLVEVQR